jgi:hypothetical protein
MHKVKNKFSKPRTTAVDTRLSVMWGKYLTFAIVLFLAILLVIKSQGASILKLYIESGMGSCQKNPIFCMAPSEEITLELDRDYLVDLLPYKFPKMEIYLPRGFTVVKELIKKVYYKKKGKRDDAIIYLLQERPKFFMELYPQFKKETIKDNYDFVKHVMNARMNEIKTLSDAFFVIMKGIFTPDLGNQKNLKMVHFIISDKKGFINYNLSSSDNYFDCNIINERGTFFKIYIKDKGAKLDLRKVITIITTLREID